MAAVQIDPVSQVPPAVAGADIGEVTHPGAVGLSGNNYYRNYFSTTRAALVLLLRHALKPRPVLVLSASLRMRRATRWRLTLRPTILS
jgi:hypothetical protein